MPKYKYSANVDLKRGNVTNGTTLNFTVDEKVFAGKSNLKELNQIALKYVKSQNKVKISEYEKAEVRGFKKIGLASTPTKSKTTNTYRKTSNSKNKKSGGITLFIVRIVLRIFGSILRIFK